MLNTSVPFKRVTEAALTAFPLLPAATFQEAVMESPSDTDGVIDWCRTLPFAYHADLIGLLSNFAHISCCAHHLHADRSCTLGDTRAFYNKKFLPAMEVRSWPHCSQQNCDEPASCCSTLTSQ